MDSEPWHGAGARGGSQNQAIGRSRDGLTSKIVALVDALGNLARFVLLPGQRHDSVGVEPLIDGVDFAALIGDKAFDANWLRAKVNERGALAVIPPNASRAGKITYDAEMYKWRHLVENVFQKLKAQLALGMHIRFWYDRECQIKEPGHGSGHVFGLAFGDR